MLAVASRLGPYEIVAPLGAGGMGEVYRARDTRLGRDVAVKVLRADRSDDPGRLARFEREARAVAALSHPNILSIHDYGTHESTAYAVMELLEGETLRDRLKKGRLPWREAVEVGASIADGLAAAHTKGIVHRDLKPENLFLTADGRVKILDFGLARVAPISDPQAETGPYVPEQTSPGTVMGTVGYMSPEQVRGQPADARSDLFSFGCVLFEVVTGRRAFHRDTAAETMAAILRDEPAESDTPLPPELGLLLRQCLAKNPNQRLQSARDLALGLRTSATDPGLHQTGVTPRRLRPIALAFAIVVLLVGIAGASWYFLFRDGNGSNTGTFPEAAKPIDALAVLPFQYTGGDANTAIHCETLADHIGDCLRQVGRRDFIVRPSTSAARYARLRVDTITIGRELNVPLLVTGTIRQQGEDLAITVEVVDARDDTVRWRSRSPYLGKMGNSLDLDLQDQIVQDVAANLGLRFSVEEQRRLTRRRTADKEAYYLYREAMTNLGKFTPAGINAGIDSGKRAIERDRNYALAYAVVARCYVLRGSLYDGPKKTFSDVRTYADEALKLDPDLADGHTALAIIHLFHDWDWSAADRELDRAIALDPTAPLTWNFRGFSLAVQGRVPEALDAIRRGQKLDPLSAGRRNELAMCHIWLRDSDLAIAEARHALELDPDFPLAYASLGQALVQKGMYEEAVAEMQKALKRGPMHPSVRGVLGVAYAKDGKKTEAQSVLKELTGLSPGRFAFALPIARIHAALGENDPAFEWLKKALDERDSQVVWIKVDPALDSLRSDPRFVQILKDMKLSQ